MSDQIEPVLRRFDPGFHSGQRLQQLACEIGRSRQLTDMTAG